MNFEVSYGTGDIEGELVMDKILFRDGNREIRPFDVNIRIILEHFSKSF